MKIEIGSILKFDGNFYKVCGETPQRFVCKNIVYPNCPDMKFRKSDLRVVGDYYGCADLSSDGELERYLDGKKMQSRLAKCIISMREVRRDCINKENVEAIEKFLKEIGAYRN